MEKKSAKFKTTLVIDDEEIDLFLAEKILTGSNYSDNIVFYNNARFALSYLENIKEHNQFPDLILLDLNMPAYTGEDFLIGFHQALSEVIRKKTKLVVLTAYKFYHEAKDINTERFPSLAKIIEKPLKLDELDDLL